MKDSISLQRQKSHLFFEGETCPDSVLCIPYEECIYDKHSNFQHIQVMRTQLWGNMLLLDGIIQLCDKFEKTYHEMMVHVGARSAEVLERVLIVGGGDGGCLREVLRYKGVKEVILCDIDPLVTEVSRKFFPEVSKGFLDTRTTLVHRDGMEFVEGYEGELFDLIIIDSTDEFDIGSQLHSEKFFKIVCTLLNKKGAVACYGDSPFGNWPFYKKQFEMLQKTFSSVLPYIGYVPMYNTGCWGFFACFLDTMVSPPPSHSHEGSFEDLEYYHLGIHQSCFELPRSLMQGIQNMKL